MDLVKFLKEKKCPMCGNAGFLIDNESLWGVTGFDYTISNEIPNFTPNKKVVSFHAAMCKECKYTLFFQHDPK